jgi:hypothetical protein
MEMAGPDLDCTFQKALLKHTTVESGQRIMGMGMERHFHLACRYITEWIAL